MEEGGLVGWPWVGVILESMKILGFQGRSPGAPGPLTLREVEQLEELTQKLMQDMEHPQRQNMAENMAVNGESPTCS